MGTPSAGEVILVPFPFSDLSASKLRPAVCLAGVERGDWVLCQVTSRPYADPAAVELRDTDFLSGGLQRTSYARPGKLFTANTSLFAGSAGRLNDAAVARLIEAVVRLIRSGSVD